MEPRHEGGDVDGISERMERSLCMDSENTEDRLETYNRLVQEAKAAGRSGDMHKALNLFEKAYNIRPSEKLQSRIQKVKEFLSEVQSEDEADEDFVDVNGSGLLLFKDLHDKLYNYQKEGVAFLYSLYRDGLKGGILADDMGLGKTIQVISFLSGMYDAEHVKSTMLVVPTSLITNWTKEFAKWTPGMRVKEFHGSSKTERMRNLEKVQRRGGVIITTYNMLLSNWQILSAHQGREFAWDYMILDEAHKIKSATTKTAKSATAIPSKNRVLLTGTPVQNNLREMWALFDFACQGALLGTAKTFKAEYENPITRAREKDSTPGEKVLGSRMSENLMAIIKPHFLRRTKAEVQKLKPDSPPLQNGGGSEEAEEKSSGATMPKLTRKNDLIVWTYLSAVQEDIYRQFISLDHIKELLMTSKSPLAQLTILKKLCDHPRLLSAGSMAKLGLDDHEGAETEGDPGHDIANVPDDALVSESGKMVFLFTLLERLKEEGHRTLIFAHYRKILDILERILKNRGFRVMRLDGTITHMAERERRITQFQKDRSYTVFLLTTQVGGVGITLTAADRVVIYDPSWNPATDAQAVDRAYRIGQKENVVIYRLITCGTVEEKIYRRQVFKDSLIRQNTGDKKNPFRYFSKQELRELFTLEDTKSSSTQLQLQALHARQRRTDAELDEHIAHLHAMDIFGISDHDLMFSVNVNQEEAPEDQEECRYIEGRVQKAQELMKAECHLQAQLTQSMASSTEAAWLRLEQQPKERRPRYPTQDLRSPPAQPEPPAAALDLDRSVEKIDLTVEQSTEDEFHGEIPKDDSGPNPTEQTVADREEIVISDDETHFAQNIKREMNYSESNGDVSMNGLEQNDQNKDQMENGDCSMNNLVIEDSIEEEVMDTSGQNLEQKEQGGVSSSSYFSAEDDKAPEQTPKLQKMDLGEFHGTPLTNKHLSMLQSSFKSSFKSENGTNTSNPMESFEGNFNLQLDDDSDIVSDHDVFDDKRTDEEERAILSKLQLEGSFNVDKSLAENRERSAVDASANDSVVAASKRKRAARIYSDDDEEEEEKELEESFHMLGASTPKAAEKNLNRSRKSLSGSVASRRSFVLSLMDDVENQEEESEGSARGDEETDSEEDSDDGQAEGEAEESRGGVSLERSEAEEEEEFGVTSEESEPIGETLNSEDEEETLASTEASTGDPELSSDERLDKHSAPPDGERDDYDSLVQRGRDCVARGQQEEALGHFLRAIDMKPGDPEIQLLTIQLYRKLSSARF